MAIIAATRPASGQSGMSFSVYNDANPLWSGGTAKVSAHSSVQDLSWGCSHSGYYTTTRIISPSGRQGAATASGLSATTSLAFNDEPGQWQVVTEGTYFCSCIMNYAAFGRGISIPVDSGTSRSSWGPWAGEIR